jgi:hypothetical protein
VPNVADPLLRPELWLPAWTIVSLLATVRTQAAHPAIVWLLKTSSDDLQPVVVSGSTQVVTIITRAIASWFIQKTRRHRRHDHETSFG